MAASGRKYIENKYSVNVDTDILLLFCEKDFSFTQVCNCFINIYMVKLNLTQGVDRASVKGPELRIGES
jgi:hypothetical protein